MTSEPTFERDLPGLLMDLYVRPSVEYRDDILDLTANMRQRPTWTFLPRWLPMAEFQRRRLVGPALPWRTIGVALLIALLVSAALLYAGSQQKLPPPFGLAKNGLVVYSQNGDIYTVDPRTQAVRGVVTGVATDVEPRWSLDGTRFVFERRNSSDPRFGQLFVARADGSEVTLITPGDLLGFDGYSFSPDGQEVVFSPILISSTLHLEQTIAVAKTDGSGVHYFDVGLEVDEPAWRPPDGHEIVFVGNDGDNSNGQKGLYLVNADGTNLRTLVAPSVRFDLAGPKWSPDGSHLAYTAWDVTVDAMSARQHIVAADGTGDRMTPLRPGVRWEAAAGWSNDGTKLAVIRSYTDLYEAVYGAVFAADGSGPDVQSDQPLMTNHFFMIMDWSPDDSMILVRPTELPAQSLQQVLFDPVAGRTSTAPWTTTSVPTWQRLKP